MSSFFELVRKEMGRHEHKEAGEPTLLRAAEFAILANHICIGLIRARFARQIIYASVFYFWLFVFYDFRHGSWLDFIVCWGVFLVALFDCVLSDYVPSGFPPFAPDHPAGLLDGWLTDGNIQDHCRDLVHGVGDLIIPKERFPRRTVVGVSWAVFCLIGLGMLVPVGIKEVQGIRIEKLEFDTPWVGHMGFCIILLIRGIEALMTSKIAGRHPRIEYLNDVYQYALSKENKKGGE